MTEEKSNRDLFLIRGAHGLLLKLTQQHNERAARREPHPQTVLIEPRAYDLFIESMRAVNRKIGMTEPLDELYVFRGIKLRRGPDGK